MYKSYLIIYVYTKGGKPIRHASQKWRNAKFQWHMKKMYQHFNKNLNYIIYEIVVKINSMKHVFYILIEVICTSIYLRLG